MVKLAEPVKDVTLSPSLNWPVLVCEMPFLFLGLMMRMSMRLL